MTLGSSLYPIISDGTGSIQPFFDVPGLKDLAALMGLIGPNSREAVSLQFHPHRQFVPFSRVNPRLKITHLVGNTEKGLNMMAHLMGNNIGLSKIP